MRVSTWMSQPVIVAKTEDSAKKASEVMQLAGVHHMPVIDRAGELIGILSDRDLRRPSWCAQAMPESTTVGAMMSDVVLTVAPDDAIGQVAELLVESRTHAVPVVGPHGEVEGILAMADVVRALLVHLPRKPRTD